MMDSVKLQALEKKRIKNSLKKKQKKDIFSNPMKDKITRLKAIMQIIQKKLKIMKLSPL